MKATHFIEPGGDLIKIPATFDSIWLQPRKGKRRWLFWRKPATYRVRLDYKHAGPGWTWDFDTFDDAVEFRDDLIQILTTDALP